MPMRPVRMPLVAALVLVGLAVGAGVAVVGHLLDNDVAEQVKVSNENQDGLVCGFGKLAAGLVSIVDPVDRPPEVDELDAILTALDVDAACARLLEARGEEDPADAARLDDLVDELAGAGKGG